MGLITIVLLSLYSQNENVHQLLELTSTFCFVRARVLINLILYKT